MESVHGKTPLAKRLLIAGGTVLALAGAGLPASGADLKLVDTPLNQVIELYSKETGRSVFIDEGVQTQRRVNAHLRGMNIEDAFAIIQRSMGLESKLIGTGTLLVFPGERANRYQASGVPFFLRVPRGIDPKWIIGMLNAVLPSLKVMAGPGDERVLMVVGQDSQVQDAKDLTSRLPETPKDRVLVSMSEGEAKLALAETNHKDMELEASPGGLAVVGNKGNITTFLEGLNQWRLSTTWKREVFTPERLDTAKALKAAETLKGRGEIKDLGGTGSLLVEGPASDLTRILEVLRALDIQERRSRREVNLDEMKPEIARDAVKGLGVEVAGDRRLVLTGKPGAIEDAQEVLKIISKKKRQVLVRLRLAEFSKSRLRTLGVDLDKNAYGYGEIKTFHPTDTLPILLRVMDEGKDAQVLAEPNLRVIEGEEAKVTIGDRIPLEVSATAQTDSGSTLKLNTQLQWVDVGIMMKVKNVAVNSDNSIRMNIIGEVSSVVATTKQGFPQIRTREAESSLRVENGGAIVMGGLLNREERESRNKIPWLGNLPGLGAFARSRDRQKGETEIIMVVTASLTEE